MRALLKKIVLWAGVPFEYFEEKRFLGRADVNELSKLKDKFKGERCFILGNGPSLNKLDLNLLKDEYSFAVNGIFYKTEEMGYKPTFYVVEDTAVMKENIERIKEYEVEYKFFPARYKKYFRAKHRKNILFFYLNEGFYIKGRGNFEFPRFSQDASDRLYCGQSVTIVNLQLAYFLGFSEIILIGMDFDSHIPDTAKVNGDVIVSTEDDVNHFHPQYFGKGKTWHDPKLHNVLKSYRLCKFIYEEHGRKIIIATKGGRLEIFPRRDFYSLF